MTIYRWLKKKRKKRLWTSQALVAFTYNPSYLGAKIKRTQFQASPGKKVREISTSMLMLSMVA
jgi:hypothetical protein